MAMVRAVDGRSDSRSGPAVEPLARSELAEEEEEEEENVLESDDRVAARRGASLRAMAEVARMEVAIIIIIMTLC